MEEINNILDNAEQNMANTITAFKSRLETLNAGRANPNLLNNLKVEAYGSITMLNQLANISVVEGRTLIVNIWDKSLVNVVDSAIRAANLGFNPLIDGNILKIHIPQPTEERRKQLCKLASTYAEESKATLKKHHRREALDKIETLKKSSSISEDDFYSIAKKIEVVTNNWVIKIDELLKKKIKELETI